MDGVVLPRETALGLVAGLKAALVEGRPNDASYADVFRTLIVLEKAVADPEGRVYLAYE